VKDTVSDLFKMGLGTMAIAKEKSESVIKTAIEKGQMSKEEGEKVLDQLQNEYKPENISEMIKNVIKEQLESLGLATKKDIDELKEEIISLKDELKNK